MISNMLAILAMFIFKMINDKLGTRCLRTKSAGCPKRQCTTTHLKKKRSNMLRSYQGESQEGRDDLLHDHHSTPASWSDLGKQSERERNF